MPGGICDRRAAEHSWGAAIFVPHARLGGRVDIGAVVASRAFLLRVAAARPSVRLPSGCRHDFCACPRCRPDRTSSYHPRPTSYPSPRAPLVPFQQTSYSLACTAGCGAHCQTTLQNCSARQPTAWPTMSSHPTLTSSYRSRAGLPTTGALASYLLRLMSIKQTNLCLSADVETSAELLQLAEDVGDSICILKTHCDIVTDWSDRTAQALREIGKRKWFLIFEDRKFADIGGMSALA